MTLDSPQTEAETFLRNTIAQSPRFGDQWEVINIESLGTGLLLLDLDDGTSIALTVERSPRDSFDEGTLQRKLASGTAKVGA